MSQKNLKKFRGIQNKLWIYGYMDHSCEFGQFKGAGGSAVLIANFFYKSSHQNKTFYQAKTFKNKIKLSRIFLNFNFDLFLAMYKK